MANRVPLTEHNAKVGVVVRVYPNKVTPYSKLGQDYKISIVDASGSGRRKFVGVGNDKSAQIFMDRFYVVSSTRRRA